MKILVVEDEPALADSIARYLREEGYVCSVSNNYADAHQAIHVYEYDCVLVDIMLPDGSGMDLVDEMKKLDGETGIIIISAKDSLDDKIKGLELGSDDYITKPFHLSELNARIKALLRRKQFKGEKEIQVGEVTVRPDRKEAEVNGQKLNLTAREYELLNYFLVNANRVLTKEAIVEHVWGDHYDMVDSFDFIYVHINKLRKKMREAGGRDPIKTVYGMGYKYEAP